ncbi:molybdenum cofactor sulfurase [Terrihabitans soli]|uniref:Molybdenum cofactor sulfurase n=1 Tax=Terrihabitans soli TaxID=708113 RepID=A0A6S6QP89_9HYPH|nr:MOSC domain-containing protein [Terrihabitans soli]BCJ89737.1 molybdenum cofactor sulfurase [Terrihabitans soli]
MISVKSLQRYPVKGLSAETLPFADLSPGETLSGDRAFAVENGPSSFDPEAPSWMPKIKFLCWMKNPKLARLASHYDDATSTLTIENNGAKVSGDLSTADGRAAIEAFLADFMDDEARGALRVLSSPGHSFSDVAKKVVSFINLASAEDLGRVLGAPVDPIRFRGNVHLAGMEPWIEATWVGREFQIGEAKFKVRKTIQRCLATHVDPVRGVRDLDIMGTIKNERGDLDCGIYAEVMTPGRISEGDELKLI